MAKSDSWYCLKARLHKPFFTFLPQKLDAIFVAPKLQIQNRTCNPGLIFSAICRRDIAGVLNVFEICFNFRATKIARVNGSLKRSKFKKFALIFLCIYVFWRSCSSLNI